METVDDRIEGAVYGSAFGDARGWPTEFRDYQSIMRMRPETPEPLVVTDDTQMSLYTLDAVRELLEVHDAAGLAGLSQDADLQAEVRRTFMKRYIRFGSDPNNNRAPGVTCMKAIAAAEANPELAARPAVNGSLGCGTIMRTPWLGLLNLSEDIIVALAMLQSQTTHGHPKGWVASAVCSLAIARLLHRGQEGREAVGPEALLQAHDAALANPLVAACASDAAELRAELERLALHPLDPDGVEDNPCSVFGEGWIANETLAVAYAEFVRRPEDSEAGIRTLAYTSGDSDSLAAVGGAFFGVYNGYSGLGIEPKGHFEARYEQELAEAVAFIRSTYR